MKKLTPYLIPLSLLVIALSIFSLDYESKMGSEPMMGATTKIKLTDPNSVTPVATSTPTAGLIPTMELIGFGDGASGTIAIGSGTTTIDLGGKEFPVFNFTSITVTGTGKIAFSNPHAKGSVVVINVIGNVTISSTADAVIDLRNIGSAVASTTGALDSLDHASTGAIYTYSAFYATPVYTKASYKTGYPTVSAGSMGGGGSAGNGQGGGGLLMRVGGNLTFYGTINATGGGYPAGVYAPCAGHKRGGGSGGDVYIGYKGTYVGTGTINNAGGRGEDSYASDGGGSGNNYSYYGAGSSIGAGAQSGSGCSQVGSAGGIKAGGSGAGYCSSCVNQNLTKTAGAGGASDGGLIEKIYQ